ncbi:ABC transporter permease subunit [Caloramator sp. CAR-1]|uniref:ABC transporter permease n=1 Tax=Caloramator sp. CAR-1 TaxID=3062777 RepID=UPI0026E250DA|nr:ABC transporter permease subunit [Caloramator sp. CAR-1]MDO6354063.1 ABC transporter permease subunit [Caloramator sp. CAR-1]
MKIKGLLTGLIVTFLLLPIIIMLFWSISSSWPWPRILPQDFTLRAYFYIFDGSTKMFKILLNSVFLSFVVTVLTLLISVPAARALAFYNFKGKNLIKILIFLPLIIPVLPSALGIHLIFARVGLANTNLGVILIHIVLGLPYGVKILTNVFEFNGNGLELQARTLGASSFQVFRYITIPLIKFGLVVSGSIIFIISFTQYFVTFLIGGGRVITYSMLLFPFLESGDRTVASALSVIFVLCILVVLKITEIILGRFYEIKNEYLM